MAHLDHPAAPPCIYVYLRFVGIHICELLICFGSLIFAVEFYISSASGSSAGEWLISTFIIYEFKVLDYSTIFELSGWIFDILPSFCVV